MRGRAVGGKIRPVSVPPQWLKAPARASPPSCRSARRALAAPAFHAATPQLLACESCAIDQRLELRPHDLRMHACEIRHLCKAAVRARNHVLAPNKSRETDDAFGDQLRMLHAEIGRASC